MEATAPKTGKYVLNYGLILGALGVVFGVMLYILDAHTSREPSTMVISLLMTIGVIFWAVYEYRKDNNGLLSIGQALKLGAGIGLIAAILGILWQLVLVEFLDPEFPAKVMDIQTQELVASGELTPEQAQQQKEMGIKFFWFGYPVYLIMSILIGLVVGLVAGLVFKRSQPAY